ncbi:MAG: hypothetical protein DI536_27340 [Archangium gephyra]|uniref:Uncharacterized protein n=1 Tax=Archangium gephyra TaxID=48 RepID=A0A2W5UF68_9BACT|nr:MAG: hypothetical protein DI536_27340 [Archangium gephyra]
MFDTIAHQRRDVVRKDVLGRARISGYPFVDHHQRHMPNDVRRGDDLKERNVFACARSHAAGEGARQHQQLGPVHGAPPMEFQAAPATT